MSEDNPRKENESIAIELQNKYHFYFVGLTFTVLALAVQTAKFGTNAVADRLELAGWTLLAVSAFSGLSHIEWLSPLYNYFSIESGLRRDVSDLKTRKVSHGNQRIHNLKTNQWESINENIQKAEESLGKIHPKVSRLRNSLRLKYRLMKYGFVFGVFFLMAGRGWAPIESIAVSTMGVLGSGKTSASLDSPKESSVESDTTR